MTKKKIINKIFKNNKIVSIEKFIKLCLFSKEGYYKKSNVIGKEGDFITSSEISQLFGEIFGIFIIIIWQNKIKKKFNFIELGPGNGTFLMDLLKITNKFKNFNKALNIHLIEKNINLIQKQQKKLLDKNYNLNKITWSKNFNIKNKEPSIIFANEFFDCFPIRQFYYKNNQWFEKMVTVNNDDCSLKFVDSKINQSIILNKLQKNSSMILEISKSREDYFNKICRHINLNGGMIIIVDYGYTNYPSNFTLQSTYNNKKSNIFENIGEQDITSLVDFGNLLYLSKKNKLNVEVFTTQREFLLQNGIKERGKKILENCNTVQKKLIKKGLERIIDKEDMGSLFKVLVLSKWKK